MERNGESLFHVCAFALPLYWSLISVSLCTYSECLASVVQANADPSVINCLHNLSRRIATVLQHEERRCQYLTREAKLILALQDEVSAIADGEFGSLWSTGLLWLTASLCIVSLEGQLVILLCSEAIADNALSWLSSSREGQACCLLACRFDHMPVLFVDVGYADSTETLHLQGPLPHHNTTVRS